MVALDAPVVLAEQAPGADVALAIATAIRLGDTEATRNVLERIGYALDDEDTHSGIVRRGIATLSEVLRDATGDATEWTHELALMAANLSPALRSACQRELRALASIVPDDKLVPLLDAPSPHIRIGARLLTGWLGEPSIIDTNTGDPRSPVVRAALDAWPAVGEEPPPWPESADPTVADEVRRILADLCHPIETVRRAAIERCRALAITPSIRDALLGTAMHDSSGDIRVEAMRAFIGRPHDVRLAAAERGLTSHDPDVQCACVELLVGRCDEDIALLVEFVEKGDPSAATRAADLLAELPPSEAMTLLWASLPRAAPGTQQAIVGRLGEIDERTLALNVRLALRGEGGTGQFIAGLTALGVLEDEPVAPLVDSLSHRDPDVRLVALRSLGRRSDPEAGEAVARRLSDPAPKIRDLAVTILRTTQGVRAAPLLIAAAGDPDEDVRRRATDAVKTLSSPEVVGQVVRGLGNQATEHASSELLVELGTLATEALVDAIAAAAPRTAGKIGEILRRTEAAPWLARSLLDRDPRRRLNAVEAVAAMGEEGVEDTLFGLMQDPEPDVRCRAAELLGELGDEASKGRLGGVRAQEPDARVAAAIDASLVRMARRREDFDELRAVDLEKESVVTGSVDRQSSKYAHPAGSGSNGNGNGNGKGKGLGNGNGNSAHRLNVLAVGAHPDDIELGCAGALLAHRAVGDAVSMLVMSRGELGPQDSRSRAAEQEAAARILGAELYWGGFDDASVPDGREAVDALQFIMDLVRPDVVYTHSPNDSHQDHRATALATLAASRRSCRVLKYEAPSSLGFTPVFYVDVCAHMERKLQALRAHESQVLKNGLVDLEAVEAQARYRGFQARIKLGEAFEVERFLWDLRRASMLTVPVDDVLADAVGMKR